GDSERLRRQELRSRVLHGLLARSRRPHGCARACARGVEARRQGDARGAVRGRCRGGEFESAWAVVLCGFGDGVYAELVVAGCGAGAWGAGGGREVAAGGAAGWLSGLEAC